MQNQKSGDVADTYSYLPRDDWRSSPSVAILEQFQGCTSILKVRGHSNRADFLYLSDEPGFLTLYRWDPVKQEGERILSDDEPVTDSPINGDFAMHPCAPWAIYTQDTKGDQNCTLYVLDYSTGEKTELARSIGRVDFLVPYGDEAVIVVAGTLEGRRVIELTYKGKVRELFKTDQQILSVAVSEKHGLVVIPVGRKTTELVVIDVKSGAVKHRILETETSKEGCLAIDDEAGCLAFATNTRGDTDEIVVRSLETFELLHRVPVAGEVGFFVLDLKCMEWSSPDELFVV
ncbi:MAG: hypothetical protein GY847_19230, partial [Proteobacteria bacterium]|nr:hypothetical protein [Pseudomonadota bacterium]